MKARFFYLLVVVTMISMLGVGTVSAATLPPLASAKEPVDTYIIVLTDPPVPMYTGGIAGLKPTSIRVTGATKLDPQSPAVVAYKTYLENKQAHLLTAMEKTLGHAVDVLFTYQFSLNGMAVKLSPSEVAVVREMAGVKDVLPDWTEYVQTDAGPAWVGAPSIWDGSATGATGTMGEGIVVGIVDTGINMDHPSFADVGGDGYDHTNPRGKFYGWCDPASDHYTTTVKCNDKLIGVWSGDEDLPEDYNGHGSHVASTVAGNVLTATFYAHTTVITRQISGVAPHANIIAYNIEGTPGEGSASGAVILAATEQAIKDQVDVINYSFGGGAYDPWLAAVHWLNVRAAGIFVATSAGNSGPRPGSVGSPANAPWIMSVASSSHNRRLPNKLMDMEGGENPPADITGAGITKGYGPAEIVYAGWYSGTIYTDTEGITHTMSYDEARMCLQPFPAGTFNGEIVVCDRGLIARVGKGYNVLQGGAGGYVLANAASNGDSINADNHYLPAVHITYNDAVRLESWLTNTVVQTATISGATISISDTYGDIMSSFSSRGPNIVPDILKPNIAAPGQDILAAVATDHENPSEYPEFDFYSGTSMASPHVAGVAALIRALHPDWTPAQVQSAIETTAINSGGFRKEDSTTPADPFDIGGGRAYAPNAAKAGLLLDESAANFWAANPAAGGDPTTLNLPDLAEDVCMRTCSWVRTVESSLDYTETWTVSVVNPTSVTLSVEPSSFTLAPGAKQVVTVTADASELPFQQWAFGAVKFTPATTKTVEAHFPVAVKTEASDIPTLVKFTTYKTQETRTISGYRHFNEITNMAIKACGLQPADLLLTYLNQDPTPSSISLVNDPSEGILVLTKEITTTDKRLVAEVLDTTSPDLDLYIFADIGGSFYNMCTSATSTAYEYCNVVKPPAGTYYIILQNWQASHPYTTTVSLWDKVIFATAVVPDGTQNGFTATSPVTQIAAAQPFSITVGWNLQPGKGQTAMLLGAEKYYGIVRLGTDADNPDNIGYTSVDVLYTYPKMLYLPLVMRSY